MLKEVEKTSECVKRGAHAQKLILLHGIIVLSNLKLISQTENDSQTIILYTVSDKSL